MQEGNFCFLILIMGKVNDIGVMQKILLFFLNHLITEKPSEYNFRVITKWGIILKVALKFH